MKKITVLFGIIGLVLLVLGFWDGSKNKATIEEYREVSAIEYFYQAELIADLGFQTVGGKQFELIFGDARSGYNGSIYQAVVSLEGLRPLSNTDVYRVYLVKPAIQGEREESAIDMGTLEYISGGFNENDQDVGHVLIYQSDLDITDHRTLIVVYESGAGHEDSGSVLVTGEFLPI